jgi:hypothetical protein
MENTDNEKIIEAFKKLCKDSIYFIPKFSKNSPIGTFKSNAEDALTTILVVYDDNDDDNCITAYQKREDFLESLELKGTNTNFGDIADIKEFANAVYNSLKSTNGIRFCVFEKC